MKVNSLVMLRLQYVPGSHDFGHRGRNGVTVTHRRGTGSTNVARRGCRDHRDKFLNSQKICHGRIDLLICAVVEQGERNKTWQNVIDLNKTWSMSVAGRLAAGRQTKVCQVLLRSATFSKPDPSARTWSLGSSDRCICQEEGSAIITVCVCVPLTLCIFSHGLI